MSLHMCDMVFPLHMDGYTNYHDTLKFLKVYKHSDHIKSKLHLSSDDTNLLSSKLRLLHWDTLPLTTLPCRFRPIDIVEVSLRRSNLTIFRKETMGMPNLKRLDLSESENLEQLPDLSMAVNLEELITRGCKRLKRIPESISSLTMLTKLDVSYCDQLYSCHITIRELSRSYPRIALYFSDKEVEMESIANLTIGGNIHILMLWLDGNADHVCFSTEHEAPNELMKKEQQLPHNKPPLEFSMRTLCAVPEFHGHEPMRKAEQKPEPMSEFHNFSLVHIIRFNYNSAGATFLCYSLSMFPFLKELNLINLNIELIPDDVCGLHFLEKLDWSGNDFETLPETMYQLTRLKYASLCNCRRLQSLPELVQLEKIKLSGCTSLQLLFNISHTEQDWGRFQLLELWIDECKNIESISDQLGNFMKLSYVDLSSNDFETLPSSIGNFSSLRTLCLNKCKKLKSIERVPLCLKHLYAHGCESLERISLPLNHSVQHLDLSHCFCLKQVEHFISQFLNGGENEEDSLRFAFFPGTEVPSYFDNINTREYLTIGLPRPSPKLLGFDGCIVIACERPFHMQFPPFSYDWNWGDESYFRLYLKPDFRDSSFHSEDEEEAVNSDHLVIIRGLKIFRNKINKFGIQSDLQFSEEFKSPPAKLKSCGFNLICENDQVLGTRLPKISGKTRVPKIIRFAL